MILSLTRFVRLIQNIVSALSQWPTWITSVLDLLILLVEENMQTVQYFVITTTTLNLKKFMKARQGDIKRLKTGGLLSEFYVINAEGEKNIEMMNECDSNLQSWFGWIYPISQKELPR